MDYKLIRVRGYDKLREFIYNNHNKQNELGYYIFHLPSNKDLFFQIAPTGNLSSEIKIEYSTSNDLFPQIYSSITLSHNYDEKTMYYVRVTDANGQSYLMIDIIEINKVNLDDNNGIGYDLNEIDKERQADFIEAVNMSIKANIKLTNDFLLSNDDLDISLYDLGFKKIKPKKNKSNKV